MNVLRFDASIPLPSRALRAALAGLGVVALLAARFFPFTSLPPLCSFKLVTGLPCFGCGMTRSWVHLLHGEIAEAWSMSPLGLALCLATVGGLAYGALRHLGLPALRANLSARGTFIFRTLAVLAILANWAYVLSAGRA